MESADAGGFDAADRPIDGVCAAHPERRASIECPHCGSYACGDCTVDTLWGDVMCDECQRHGRARYPVPWEESSSPIAFVHTAYLVFADTASLFGALPAGRVRRAIGFSACVALLTALATGLTRWSFAPRHWAERGPGLLDALLQGAVRDAIGTVLFVAAVTLAFHGAAAALGGRGPLGETLRAVCYVTAIDLLATAGAVIDAILGDNTFTILFGLVALFFVGWALCAYAEQRQGLSRRRAVLAGAAPVALLLAFVAGLIAATVLFAPQIAALTR